VSLRGEGCRIRGAAATTNGFVSRAAFGRYVGFRNARLSSPQWALPSGWNPGLRVRHTVISEPMNRAVLREDRQAALSTTPPSAGSDGFTRHARNDNIVRPIN
jgi:hypothetical protein